MEKINPLSGYLAPRRFCKEKRHPVENNNCEQPPILINNNKSKNLKNIRRAKQD